MSGNPTFFAEGDTPRPNDTIWRILQKTLAATGNGGGGSGGAQLVVYTSGIPANPTDPDSPALAYDPTGSLPTLGWNTSTHTWN